MESVSSKFNNDMQAHITSFNKTKQELDVVLKISKEQSIDLLNKISSEIEKITSTLKEYDVKLHKNLDAIFMNLNSKHDTNSGKLDAIDNKITQHADNINSIIKECEV